VPLRLARAGTVWAKKAPKILEGGEKSPKRNETESREPSKEKKTPAPHGRVSTQQIEEFKHKAARAHDQIPPLTGSGRLRRGRLMLPPFPTSKLRGRLFLSEQDPTEWGRRDRTAEESIRNQTGLRKVRAHRKVRSRRADRPPGGRKKVNDCPHNADEKSSWQPPPIGSSISRSG